MCVAVMWCDVGCKMLNRWLSVDISAGWTAKQNTWDKLAEPRHLCVSSAVGDISTHPQWTLVTVVFAWTQKSFCFVQPCFRLKTCFYLKCDRQMLQALNILQILLLGEIVWTFIICDSFCFATEVKPLLFRVFMYFTSWSNELQILHFMSFIIVLSPTD